MLNICILFFLPLHFLSFIYSRTNLLNSLCTTSIFQNLRALHHFHERLHTTHPHIYILFLLYLYRECSVEQFDGKKNLVSACNIVNFQVKFVTAIFPRIFFVLLLQSNSNIMGIKFVFAFEFQKNRK